MLSRTEPLLTSLERKESGSSNTSPSRFPKILLENQPSKPSILAFSPGAIMVFIKVWPVLKSFPAIATLCLKASSTIAGVSTVRLGEPLAKGTPIFIPA